MATNNEASRHSDFYISTVIFLVEDSLFRVPREPFQQESDLFCDMFSLPQGDGIVVEGSSDEIPIQLHGTSKDDFEQLLKALLHRKYGSQPNLPRNVEQWTSVLKLSTAWSFEKLRQASIDALIKHGIGAVDRVVLSQQYDIKGWLLPALNELAKRPEPITLEEANQMGIDIVLKLASVRERVTVETNCSNSAPAFGQDPFFGRSTFGRSTYATQEQINGNGVAVGSCRDPRMQNCEMFTWHVGESLVLDRSQQIWKKVALPVLHSCHSTSMSTGFSKDGHPATLLPRRSMGLILTYTHVHCMYRPASDFPPLSENGYWFSPAKSGDISLFAILTEPSSSTRLDVCSRCNPLQDHPVRW